MKKYSYIVFIGMAAQMGVTIFVGAYIGKLLDQKYPLEKKWFTISLTLISLLLAIYNVIQQLNKVNKNDE
jgi:F0F1-type ATP synthase assembly protein I